jgi:hypothetical protein
MVDASWKRTTVTMYGKYGLEYCRMRVRSMPTGP